MTELDWIVLLGLFALAVGIAYSLGRRAEPKPAAAAPAPAPAVQVPPLPAPDVAPAPAHAPEPEPEAAMPLVRMQYVEDEENDPTKIGVGARGKRPVLQAPVHRIVYDEDAERDEPTRAESLFLVSATAQTDTGLRRKRNEDSVLVLEGTNLFVVADGMGGYRGGELASQLAVKTIGDAFRSRTFDGPVHDTVPTQASELARAIQMANVAILDTATQQRELEGMGTTVCAARFSANKKRVYIGHVGDSRCYRLRAGELRQITADHTMADHGVQGPEAAHLSRAVGIWPTVPIDIVMGVPLAGDVYVLCSDGLTKMVKDDIIRQILVAEENLSAAVEQLVAFANSRGGKDNITVVLVRVVPPRDQVAQTS